MSKRPILYTTDVEKATGLHRSTLRRKWEAGLFPAPTLLDGTRLVWHIDSINQWIDGTFAKGGVHHEELKNA